MPFPQNWHSYVTDTNSDDKTVFVCVFLCPFFSFVFLFSTMDGLNKSFEVLVHLI